MFQLNYINLNILTNSAQLNPMYESTETIFKQLTTLQYHIQSIWPNYTVVL